MIGILKKLFIPSEQKQEVDAYESWIVRWHSRYDEYSSSVKPEGEMFTSKEDADKFAT